MLARFGIPKRISIAYGIPARLLLTLLGVVAVLLVASDYPSPGSGQAVAASSGPEMALTVTEGGFCAADDCYAAIGEDFKLAVDLVTVPAAGYILMQTYLDFGVFVYTPSADPGAEFIWPDSDLELRGQEGPGLVNHAGLTSFLPPLPVSNYVGIGIEILLSCPALPMQAPISLLAYDDPLVGTDGSYFTEGVPYADHIPKVDAVTMHCTDDDTDGDGCSDVAEHGADPALGGDRDWLNPWDFYDVAGPNGGSPDGYADLPNDVLGVIQHFSPTGALPYDVQYDRGPAAGPSWNGARPPDGVIDMPNDILGVIGQLGHSCA